MWAFLVSKTHGGYQHSVMNSSCSSRLLEAACAPSRTSGSTSLQPSKEGPATRQITPSQQHHLWLLLLSGEEILGLKRRLVYREAGYPVVTALVRMPEGLLDFQAGS